MNSQPQRFLRAFIKLWGEVSVLSSSIVGRDFILTLDKVLFTVYLTAIVALSTHELPYATCFRKTIIRSGQFCLFLLLTFGKNTTVILTYYCNVFNSNLILLLYTPNVLIISCHGVFTSNCQKHLNIIYSAYVYTIWICKYV